MPPSRAAGTSPLPATSRTRTRTTCALLHAAFLPTSCSPKPTARTSRHSRCAASATSPRTSCTPTRSSRSCTVNRSERRSSRTPRRFSAYELTHVPDARVSVRCRRAQCLAQARKATRRDRRERFAEPGSAGRERKAVRGVRVSPKKSLGQHFLVDENILRVIERLAELDPADVVLEVGPGLGVLTRFLAERVAFLHAVEVDKRLASHLDGIQNTTVHWGDAMRLDISRLDPPPHKLVANLPYNVATPLVAESLDVEQITGWCVMVQREVADRFFAKPSTKAYGSVSVLVQLATERTGFHPVSREVFRPRPNVESALVAFRRTAPGAPLPVKRVVEGAFGHRRKTLANSLSLSGLVTRERAVQALAAIDRDASVRAEALEPPEFVALARALT